VTRLPASIVAPLGWVTLCIALLWLLALPARGAEIEGVDFDDRYVRGDTDLHLNCVGMLRYKIFIKAYVAALYLPEEATPGEVLDDVPKRLEINYFWSIKGRDFGRAADAILADNLGPEMLESLRPRLEEINAAYEDVKPGDRYALTYLPGVGTELALNGERKALIEGADFAAAYFSIWLGEEPLDAGFRDSLLTCRNA